MIITFATQKAEQENHPRHRIRQLSLQNFYKEDQGV